MNQLFISVVIPVYNGETYLFEAIKNVRCQNYEALEIIIIDDGSTDGTGRIVFTLGGDIRYVYQPNANSVVARNQIIELATGDVLAFLGVPG